MQLYLKYFGIQIKGQMQYKVSFFLTLMGQFVTSFAALVGVYFMFHRFDEVDGFTYSQVLLCFAIILMAFSAAETFARGFDRFPAMLGDGSFDRALVRPRGVVFQVLAQKMEFSRLGRLVQGILVLAYAMPRSGVVWTWDNILTVVLMIVCGCLVFFGLFMVYAAFSFFTVEGLEFMNIFTDGGREFGRYPYAVYGPKVLRFLTYVIPLALVQYYPLLYLLGREDHFLFAITPLLSLIFLVPCYGFFRFGLRRYKSTGS